MKKFGIRRRAAFGVFSAAIAGIGIVHPAFGITDTWVGSIADTAGPFTSTVAGLATPINLYKWDTSTANWNNGGSNLFTVVTGTPNVGDDVVFTDNFTGGTDLELSGNLNPTSITFSHIPGNTPTTYTIYRSADYQNATGTNASLSSPVGSSATGTTLTLGPGFLGRVILRPRTGGANSGGATVIDSGTLEIHDGGALPGLSTQNNGPVTLGGGTLSINIDTGGNTAPASSQLVGVMTVNGRTPSTLELSRSTAGSITSSRVYNGTITVATGSQLNLISDFGVRYDLGATLAASTGTIHLNDAPSFQTVVDLTAGGTSAGSATTTFDLGTGTSILTNNYGNGKSIDIGALTGGANTSLKGSINSVTAGNVQTYSIGAANLNATFNGTITDGTGGTPISVAVTKAGTGIERLNGANTYTGVTTVKAGVLLVNTAAASNILNGTAGANVQGGDLAFDYTGGSSPATAIRGILLGELASSFATGKLASSTAAADATHLTTLGYADGADVGLSVGSSSAVVVKYTYVGDSSLDGKFDLGNDFPLFLEGYLNPAALTDSNLWALGDYNYDGVVNHTDFGLFVDGFKGQGGSLGELDGVIAASPLLSNAQKASLLSVVPEPTTLGATAVAGLAMLSRRRRK